MPNFRFSNRNRMACVTSTTGTGPYLIGPRVDPSFISPADLTDGEVVEARVIYGSNWETGSYTKDGLTMVRTAVYESTNGNAEVNWGDGDKVFSVTPLAENVAKSSDDSVQITDDPEDGRTNFQGLKLSDVYTVLEDKLAAGVDIATTGNFQDGYLIEHLPKHGFNADAGTITLDVSAGVGGVRIVSVAGNRTLEVTGDKVDQEFYVKLDYDVVGGRTVTWWDEIRWLDGYEPALTPVGGGSDTFRFKRVDASGYKYLGEVVSEHRPKIITLDVTPNVFAEVTTEQEGSTGGDNEIQFLSATIANDYMTYEAVRTGTVSGGTFKLSIQLGTGLSYETTGIPYNITARDLLKTIWSQLPYDPSQINVDGGTDGEKCLDTLSGSEARIGFQWLGKDRYSGYVMSIDGTNLTGGGSYQINAVAGGSGSVVWPFTDSQPNNISFTDSNGGLGYYANGGKLTFNGQTTRTLLWGVSGNQSRTHAEDMQEALEALSNIGVGNIRVRQHAYGVYVFEFTGDLRNTDISGQIHWADGFLPTCGDGTGTHTATGQVYGTQQNGTAPVSVDEVHRLTLTGNPTQGYVILTIKGHEVNIPVTATTGNVQALLDAVTGFSTTGEFAHSRTLVTGGPFPTDFMDITFVEEFGGQNQPDSSVDVFSAGAATIDHAICDGARVLLASAYAGGDGTYNIFHTNAIPGKPIHVTLLNEGSDVDGTFTTIRDGYPDHVEGFGTIVPGENELQSLELLNSPTAGTVVANIGGVRVQFAYNATNSEVATAINSALDGTGTVAITLGPLPATIQIEFTGAMARTNIGLSFILYPAAGSILWTGVEVDWGPADPPAIPANWTKSYLEFLDSTVDLTLGKDYFHTGEGGGGNVNAVVDFNPGIGIEIDEAIDPGDGHKIYTIHRLQTTHTDTDGALIVCDLAAEVGEDHVVTVFGNRDVDVVNEKLGEFYSLECFQGTPGNFSLTFLFEVEWAEGFQPVQTPVPGKADLFHFLCLRESGPYVTAKFRGWVETTERPQPLSDTAGPTAANEVQQIHVSPVPTGGTWTVGFRGATSNPIPYNANATTIRLILQAMPTIQNGNILVSGGRLGVFPIRLEFVNALGGQNLPQVTVGTTGLQF